jgi:hypothetical protein
MLNCLQRLENWLEKNFNFTAPQAVDIRSQLTAIETRLERLVALIDAYQGREYLDNLTFSMVTSMRSEERRSQNLEKIRIQQEQKAAQYAHLSPDELKALLDARDAANNARVNAWCAQMRGDSSSPNPAFPFVGEELHFFGANAQTFSVGEFAPPPFSRESDRKDYEARNFKDHEYTAEDTE